MDPLLLIIKYLFQKKNITNNDQGIDDFFKNGVSFPQFIKIIFDVESIPGIKENPKLVFHKKINNDTALQYLFFKNEKIKQINPSYETEKNQINLLQLIFTLQCFTTPVETIINKSNIILKELGVTITKKNDLISLKILSSILNSFTNGAFPISQNYQEIINNFQKLNIPLVFNEKCLDVQNSYIFLIQIQILFDFFEENGNYILKLQIEQKLSTDTKNFLNQKEIPKSSVEPPKETPNTSIESPKETPKTSIEPPKETPISSIESQNETPKSLIESPKETPNTSIESPKETPNTSIESPKETPKSLIESPKETQMPINRPEHRSSSIFDRIKFYNQNASNNEALKNNPPFVKSNPPPSINKTNDLPPVIQPELPKQPTASDIQDQHEDNQEDQILESRDDQIQHERESLLLLQMRNQNPLYSNDRKLDTQNDIPFDIQYSDEDEQEQEEEIESKQEIENQYSDDNDQDQETDNINEDPEEMEKEFEKFQNFMSDISDDLEEEEIRQNNEEITIKEEENQILQIEKVKEEEEEEEEEEEQNEPIGSFKELSKTFFGKVKNFLGNLKNYVKIDTVYQRIHADQSSSFEKLWNIQIDNYKYDNGILYTESILSKKEDPKNMDQTNKEPTVDTSTNDKKGSKTNLYKIMRYDEQKYRWIFCESDFEKIIHHHKDNPTIPLVLFIDSKLEDINKISSVIRKDDLLNNMDEEISVYSFWKENIDMWDYNKENEFPNTITELLFLYVYIPKSKENHKNIGTILYQIYTFLFLICDLNIVLLNNQYQNLQILFIKEIIELALLYIKDQKYVEIKSKLFYEKARLLFLQVNEQDKKEELDKIISPNINTEYEIKIIKKEREFLEYLEELLFHECYKYRNLVTTLNQVNSMFSQISTLYLYMRKEENIYDLIKEVINKKYKNRISDKESNIIDIIKSDSYQYFSNNDEHVSKIFNMVILDITIELNLFDKERIKTKLSEQSKIHLEYLEKKVNEKYYWEENQIHIINHSHLRFLEKQYFEIIKNSENSSFIDIVYENNLDLLESQKRADNAAIISMFTKYDAYIKKRNTVINESFNENSQKGTNYVMKEVESVREIEVICAAGQDIDSIIEPDF